ncbi:hypothetical protein KO317_02465 [Candidatus Micrarchaeota archaeon]|nr:hypothetical protein [Candidatus Micrarchaeota archaeon]
MDKKLLLKIAVLAIIGIFVLQMIAMPFLQGIRESSTPKKEVSKEIYVIQGETQVTVSSYSSSITVSGNIGELKQIKEQLKDNDWLDSETYISNNETIFNLKSSQYTKNVSDLLIENGYSVITGVNLKFPEKIGEVEAEDVYVVIKTAPIYNIGDNITIEFAAYVQYEKIIQLVGFELAPHLTEITLDAEVKQIKNTKLTLNLEDVEKQGVLEDKYNVSFIDSSAVFELINPKEEYEEIINELEGYEYSIKTSQTVNVLLLPSKQEGIYIPMDFVVQSSKLHELNESIQVKLTLLVDKGEIVNIFEYQIIYSDNLSNLSAIEEISFP